MKKQIFTCMLFLQFSFFLLAATVETPMTQDLYANDYNIRDVGRLYSADIISSMPRVNVRYFGANGTDTNDDTSAIQAAINYAQSNYLFVTAIPGSTYVGSAPEIYFPPGRYKVNDTLNVNGYISLVGDDSSIEMTDSGKDIVSFSGCYNNAVKRLTFIGGNSHLVFANNNTNGTLVNIEECEFHLASDFAIRLIPTSPADHLSALVTIKNCKFRNNYQAIENYADRCEIIYAWVETSATTMADGPVFSNQAGVMMLKEICGVPKPGTGDDRKTNTRWVDNYETFIAVDSRFGGEDAGIPTVYNYAGIDDVYPYLGGGKIILKNNHLCAGSSLTNACVVKMFAVPQLMVIKDNYNLSNSPYVTVDSSLNLDTCLDNITDLHEKVRYTIEPNLNWFAGEIPEQLLPFVNPLAELYRDKPETGHWEKGHILLNKNVTHGSHVGIVNTEAGEPGTWSYFGKTSPFPIGAQEATVIAGNQGKYTFNVPDKKHFTAYVTIADNPNVNGSGLYYKSQTIILSLDTGYDGTTVCDYLSYTSLHVPSAGVTPSGPSIQSIHFGSADTGSNKRSSTTGGQITIVWNNCSVSPQISIDPLFIRE